MNARLSRPRLLIAALSVGLVAVALGQGSAASAADRKAVAHNAAGKKVATSLKAPTPKLFDIGHNAGEPTVGITREGHVIVTASSGCVTSCAGSLNTLETVAPGGRSIKMTKDKGKTWLDISPGVGEVSPHVASLDPYVLVDRAGDVERTFNIDLNAACNELSYSDDQGQTWLTNPLSCGEPVNDHQTLFTGKPVTSTTLLYPKIVYYCFNKLLYTDCTKSLDGGITFLPTANTANPECSGLNGHGVTDHRGWIYLPYAGCNSTPTIAFSKDEGSTWTSLKPAPTSKVIGDDPSVAVDAKGNLYMLWTDTERRVRLATSTNGGKSWTKPVDVTAPGVKRANLATLTVGAPGKIAVAYYGTGADKDTGAFWNGYLMSGIDILGKKPLFFSASVNDPKHPLKVDACGPGRCGRVLDFIDVEIAPDGTPWAAYVDACLAVCETTKVETLDDNAGMVGTLVGGPNLRR
jgi:hypothetical protein